MTERQLFIQEEGGVIMVPSHHDVSDDEPTKKILRVTPETLQPGRRYRVIRAFADIDPGTTLRFRERTYFPYDAAWYLHFVTADGEPISVCENAHREVVSELYRYLVEER